MKLSAYHTSTVHSNFESFSFGRLFHLVWVALYPGTLWICEWAVYICNRGKRSMWIVSESQQTGGWQVDKPVAEVERCE